MITDEMRDTERDPAPGGRPATGRRCRRRIVKAFRDKLGELLHPHGYQGNSCARRRTSAPTALAAAVTREPPPGTRRRAASLTWVSSRHASPSTAIRPPTNPHANGRSRNVPPLFSLVSPLLAFLSSEKESAIPQPLFREADILPPPLLASPHQN